METKQGKKVKIKKKFGDKIFIEWHDANAGQGWKLKERACEINPKDYLCKTNAFYVDNKNGFIIVCHTIGIDEGCEILGDLRIPIQWVKGIR